MLLNYIKTAWRSILRNKTYSILNVLGLAIGMGVALLIGLWVYRQSLFDRWFPGYQQAYQVRYNYSDNGAIRTTALVCLPLEHAIRQVPGVAHVAAGFGPWEQGVEVGGKRIYPRRLIGGAEFLQVFPFPVIKGDAATALKEKEDIVLTASTAKAIFGDTDPIGKTVKFASHEVFRVTAVIVDMPRYSSFQFDMITPFEDLASSGWVNAARTNWSHAFFPMYLSLRPDADVNRIASLLKPLVQTNAPAVYAASRQQVFVQPIKDWHFYTIFKDGVAVGGMIDHLRMFSIIGAVVLLIACINFMNLSTARSEKRAREVGVRKVMGSSRRALIVQFLVESMVLTLGASVICLLLVQWALPAFNSITQSTLRMPWGSCGFWLIMAVYVLLTGFLAGSRPAFLLSGFKPVRVLKSTRNIAQGSSLSRKILVVLQFSCSIALIIGTLIVYQQIQYGRQRPLGYDPRRLVHMGLPAGKYEAFKQEMLASGLVSSLTLSLSTATNVDSHNTIDSWPGQLPNEGLTVAMNSVGDADYFRTMGMVLIAGKNFSGNPAADSLNVILNEAAVMRMRLKQPIGQTIIWSVSNAPHRLTIIGVVADALTTSSFVAAEPTMFVAQPSWAWTVTFRLASAAAMGEALSKIGDIYHHYNKEDPFNYTFVDEDYAGTFVMEEFIGKLAAIFAGLAIFISCLGLFGLASYTAEQRTREIGIRKVLGASVPGLWAMLSKEFLILVGVSFIIASPIAYWMLHNWLQGYYYRTTIGWGVFVLTAGIAFFITLATVGMQAMRAARMRPVDSLKAE